MLATIIIITTHLCLSYVYKAVNPTDINAPIKLHEQLYIN